MNNAISSLIALAPLVLSQAQTAPGAIGATELGQWLLVGAAAAVIANQGMSFFRNLTGGFARKQTPRAENMPDMILCDKRHADTDERLRLIDKSLTQKVDIFHTTVSGKVSGLETTVSQKIDNLRLEMKDDMKGVHSRVDNIMKGVARIEGKLL